MTALTNLWNSWMAFVQDHAILAPAIIGVILIATFADLIRNGLLAGQTPTRRHGLKEDSDWYSNTSHRY